MDVKKVRGEILILPFYGQGHLFPSTELGKNFSSFFNYKPTLIIPSHLSPSIIHHPSIQVLEIPPSDPEEESKRGEGFGHRPRIFHLRDHQLGKGIEALLSERYGVTGLTLPVCVVIDVMMSWSKEIFIKWNIPIVSFFTSGACSAAIEYAAWKANADEIKPGEIRILPGLPEDLALSYSDIRKHRHRPPRGIQPGPDGSSEPQRRMRPPGPPGPGKRPMWWDETEGSFALFINTCEDLDRPFIDYISNEIRKPVWGVGPLLPDKYWKSIQSGSLIHDAEVRSNRDSNYAEDQVAKWLDSKPSKSVIYISFGSEVGPTLEEYTQLADAVTEMNRPFVWVIQPGSGKPGPPPGLLGPQSSSHDVEEGYYPHGLDEKVGDRGLIIRGWAPQLLILSHPSVGGFLSHCGWNSTVEAIGLGLPILAWPIRGDQFYNAKLVIGHLKVGYMLSTDGGDDYGEMIKKEDIVQGIEKLMGNEEVHKNALRLGSEFKNGYPASSFASLKSFFELINRE